MSTESKCLIAVTLILFAVGLVMIFSATAISAGESEKFSNPFYFLHRQLLWTLFSLMAFFVGFRIDYRTWKKHALPILALAAVLLIVVLIPGIGTKLNGARRWLRIGPMSFQPSEFAKLALLIFVASYVSSDGERLKRFSTGVLPCSIAIAVICGLTICEPDVGTSLFVAAIAFAIMLVAGCRLPHLAPIAGLCTAGALLLIVTKANYIMARVSVFLDPDLDPAGKGYHIKQSLIAIGSGGTFGAGLGEGMSKLFFLPEIHSDFIFAVIGEELGFVGAATVILLFVALLVIGWRICRKTNNLFGFLLGLGIVLSLSLQAIVNMAVVTGSIPAKGIPLPFISFGGSSLLMTMFAVGILVNISNTSEKEQQLVAPTAQ
ncbi:MAG: cell division protein FtsW [Planctomycetes bacterium RBG_16_59_8]|nr:MAG: cell division protein FtsW [Planctomycetes bacterium RBG_16_59_8]